MPVNWLWKNKMGEINYGKIDGKIYKDTIYAGNCLAVFLHEFLDDKGKEHYNFSTYLLDEKHLKNCLGIAKGYEDNIFNEIKKIRLNTFFKDEVLTIAKNISVASAKHKWKIKVEFYYEKPRIHHLKGWKKGDSNNAAN